MSERETRTCVGDGTPDAAVVPEAAAELSRMRALGRSPNTVTAAAEATTRTPANTHFLGDRLATPLANGLLFEAVMPVLSAATDAAPHAAVADMGCVGAWPSESR